MNTTTMTTRCTKTEDGKMEIVTDTWRAVELCPHTWAICNEKGERYGAVAGRSTGFESRYWAEQAMKRIAKRWGYKLS